MREETRPDHASLLKQSLLAIDRLQSQLAAAQAKGRQPIAVVGMACRFPGDSDDPATFWELLREGRDAVTEVPPDRWDAERFFDADPAAVGKAYTRWGAFLKDIGLFDASFFGISPREANGVDPQHRLLLEAAWESLENAGIAPSSLAGSASGVFIGMTTHDYSLQAAGAGISRYGDAFTASGSVHSIAAGRISYLLGLHGPNMAVDTACSSSLVAIHLAIQSLRNGEASLALAGGVNLTLIPEGSILTSRARMMSADGRCKTFDAAADGYVRGEGCGMLVLKRLDDARRDGDRVLAVLRGSALNQDGRSSGMSAPNGKAQIQVIRAALANAGLAPDDIDYVEAHGTGTPLGDPIELHALGEVFGGRGNAGRLRVGSVKTNIGHLEAAAGMAGVVKTILALQNRQLPPHLHLSRPNPHVAWDRLAIDIPTRLTEWTADDGRTRRAGVSSFGFSGTNAHLILEEAPPAPPAPAASTAAPRLLVLSAQTEAALDALAARYRNLLDEAQGHDLAEVASQAITGRSHLPIRLALVASSRQEAVAKLSATAPQQPGSAVRGRTVGGDAPDIVFLFTGQGSQYPGMGRDLYREQPVFREALDRCATLLQPLLDRPLLQILWPAADEASVLDDTRYTQPALFAIEYALAKLWEAHGIRPAAVMGHSVGEYVAACIAGVFSLEDGLRLIAARARLMGSLPAGGAMAAVFASEAAVQRMIQAQGLRLSVAGINGPDNTVVSGESAAVDALLAEVAATGLDGQRLKVSHAFHSHLMDPILDAFEAVAAGVSYSAPVIGLISNVSGELAGDEILTPRYWRRHLREAVRFGPSIDTLLRDGYRVGLEVGPHPVLAPMARRCSPDVDAVWAASLRSGRDDTTAFLEGLGQLYVCGRKPDAAVLFGAAGVGRRVILPTYPFQREYFWQRLDGHSAPALGPTRTGHPLLGGRLPSAATIFQAEIGVGLQPWLGDHRIAGLTIFPAAGFIEVLLAAALEVSGGDRCAIADFRIDEALILPALDPVLLQTVVTAGGQGTQPVPAQSLQAQSIQAQSDPARFIQIFSRAPGVPDGAADGGWQAHASGRVVPEAAATTPAVLDIRRLQEALPGRRDAADYYAALDTHGAQYGPAFRGIVDIRHHDRQVLGRIRLPAALAAATDRLRVHPALLDAGLQLMGVAVEGTGSAADDRLVYVPVGFDRYTFHRRAGGEAWAHITVAPADLGAAELRADLVLADGDGRVVAELLGLVLRRISRSASGGADAGTSGTKDWAFEIDWRPAGKADVTEESTLVEPVPPVPADRWLVLGGADALGAAVCEDLRARGMPVVHVVHGERFTTSGPSWTIDAADTAQHDELLRRMNGADCDLGTLGIVSLWGLDAASTSLGLQAAIGGLDPIVAAQRRGLAATLALAKALPDASARLWVVTRGAQSIDGVEPDLVQAPLWGMAGVLASEMPALKTVRIDLDPAARPGDAGLLVEAILSAGGDDRVAVRRGRRLVARLVPARLAAHPAAQPVRLEIDQRGSLADLALIPFERTAPGIGEVEVSIRSIGLNFRDVLNALGMYPGDAGPLGNECAGVVSAVGPGVTDLEVGDEVMAMVDRCFATFVIAPATLTVRKPAFLSFTEAATIPVTFLTAEYAFRHLAGIRKGDRVLIHAVTGGVGMAAAQLALRAGAEVFGTAGSPEKRALALRLGVHHVADSRSLSFFDDLMAKTGGEGVDIVLNSLSGEFIPTSLKMLRKGGGHFIEIGKTGIWDAARVAREFPGVAYHALYLGEVAAAEPALLHDLLSGMMADFATGVLKPLPQRIYPLERAEDAFRYMGQGLHVGKIVLFPRRDPGPRADASYLITGGLGGIGLTCARWLVNGGARHLVLAGRRAPDEAAAAAIVEFEAAGVRVMVAQADMADARQVGVLFERMAATMAPLAGVLHAAGVIDDAMLPDQSIERFDAVMAPKVQGAWNLHALTAGMALDFFVVFSSGAALLGSPGQSNYAAANCFLDGLAAMRRARGLPALSINWGSWSGVGMAAGVGESHQRRWSAMGLGMIRPEDGTAMLETLLAQGASSQYAALPMDTRRLPPGLAPFFTDLVAAGPASSPAEPERDIAALLGAAAAPERRRLLVGYLSDQVSKVLALSPGQPVDAHRSILELGMDSLMAMELRNRVQAALVVQVAVADLLGGASVEALAARLLDTLRPAGSPAAVATEARLPAAPAAASLVAAGGTEPEVWEEGSL